MTQTQLVQHIADKCEVSKKVAKGVLDTLTQTAIAEVKKNGLFVIPGIGRLVRVDRKARMGRNPATGAAIKIAAKKVVKFRVAKSAKDAIVPPKASKAGSKQPVRGPSRLAVFPLAQHACLQFTASGDG